MSKLDNTDFNFNDAVKEIMNGKNITELSHLISIK